MDQNFLKDFLRERYSSQEFKNLNIEVYIRADTEIRGHEKSFFSGEYRMGGFEDKVWITTNEVAIDISQAQHGITTQKQSSQTPQQQSSQTPEQISLNGLRRIAQALMSLSHNKNFVYVYDFAIDFKGDRNIFYVIISKRYDRDLQNLIFGRDKLIEKVTFENRVEIIRSLAEGLKLLTETYVQTENGIFPLVNLDLKPSNVLIECVNEKYQAKIGDLDAVKTNSENTTSFVSGIKISPCYHEPQLYSIIPKEFEKKHPDIQSDIYSLGVTSFELLTCEHFIMNRDDYVSDIIKYFNYYKYNKFLIQRFASIKNNEINNYPNLKNLLMKMLYAEPDKRYNNIDDILEDLKDWDGSRKKIFYLGVVSDLLKVCCTKESNLEQRLEQTYFTLKTLFSHDLSRRASSQVINEYVNKFKIDVQEYKQKKKKYFEEKEKELKNLEELLSEKKKEAYSYVEELHQNFEKLKDIAYNYEVKFLDSSKCKLVNVSEFLSELKKIISSLNQKKLSESEKKNIETISKELGQWEIKIKNLQIKQLQKDYDVKREAYLYEKKRTEDLIEKCEGLLKIN